MSASKVSNYVESTSNDSQKMISSKREKNLNHELFLTQDGWNCIQFFLNFVLVCLSIKLILYQP